MGAMSLADDDEFAAFISNESALLHMTKESIEEALEGFPLVLAGWRDMAWLCMATRRALAISLPNYKESPDRTSNADIVGELNRLAEVSQSTWRELSERDRSVDDRLWEHAWHRWAKDQASNTEEDLLVSRPPDFVRFNAAIAELEWLSSFLRFAASETKVPRGPWKSALERRIRVSRARYLAPIFEAAFGSRVSANNFPSDARHRKPTPFMDFYQRMVCLALSEEATPDLSGVIKEACGLHKKYPVRYPRGVISGL
jgi:hypothetical protein